MQKRLPPGPHSLTWTPDIATPVGSYVMRLTIARKGAGTTVLGGKRPPSIAKQQAPVVRVLGVEAAFLRRSYLPGEPMELRILADAGALTLQFLHCGAEYDEQRAQRRDGRRPKGDPVPIDWTGKRSAPATITVQTGAWPTGLYTAQLTTDDGRVGYAPFVLRAATPGQQRQLVVMPTNTWQAYNMYDRDGDGWGDTWYAGGNPPVELDRPYRDRGVPPRFKAYDRGDAPLALRTGKQPDMVADDDLEAFGSGDELRALYDLVVFPGHSEYMTGHAYDVVERFRDLGGRLIFLSANNFFWRVDKQGTKMSGSGSGDRGPPRGAPDGCAVPRQRRRPASGALHRRCGRGGAVAVRQDRALDRVDVRRDGRRLRDRDRLGTPDSPPGTVVLARVTDLFGPGLSGEMTYYETPAGARVFAAGTLDFGGSVNFWPMTRMLENLWQHMLQDLPAPVPPATPPRPRLILGKATGQTSQAPSCWTMTPSSSMREPGSRRSLTRSQ